MATAAGQSRRWRQAVLLLIVGVAIGYPPLVALSHCVWSVPCPGLNLLLVGFFAGATAFISGMVLFLSIAARAVTSKPGSTPDSIARSPAAGTTLSSSTHPSRFTDAKLRGSSTVPSSATAALIWLRVAIIAVIALASANMVRRGWPSLSSRYGRYYLLSAVLTLLLSQFPFVVALIRTWKVPDHAGLALAMAAGAMQVFANMPFFYTLMNFHGMRPSESLLDIMLGAAVVVLACLSWRASGLLKGDAGLIVSIVFGFLAYTIFWRIAHSILASREHMP